MGMSLEHGKTIGMCKHGSLFGNMYYSDFEDWKTKSFCPHDYDWH